ncbi:MAG TPA: EF-P lysine aminoacylase EpmA, partial [Chlamydiales bacterium]|nr:EF-P lysine aminoacylase EpmA [Chlamydiales bacterium]
MCPALLSDLIQDRAEMLQKARDFFRNRNILEVDCCALRPRAAIDSNIEIISAFISEREVGFFHSSPEYAMKRLLAAGCQDIYFLGHVFRKGDLGPLHNPEFAMAEWYRLNRPFSDMIFETCEFLFLFFNDLPIETISYDQAFFKYVGIDYRLAPLSLIQKIAGQFSGSDTTHWNRDSCIHFLLADQIEPHLGQGVLTVLTDYPPHEAALACVIEKNGQQVAERFEIYHEGIELANGYHELANPVELRRRFEKENERRGLQGKEPYLLDEEFLFAMGSSFPDCCGVSIGFDRALMLRR